MRKLSSDRPFPFAPLRGRSRHRRRPHGGSRRSVERDSRRGRPSPGRDNPDETGPELLDRLGGQCAVGFYLAPDLVRIAPEVHGRGSELGRGQPVKCLPQSGRICRPRRSRGAPPTPQGRSRRPLRCGLKVRWRSRSPGTRASAFPRRSALRQGPRRICGSARPGTPGLAARTDAGASSSTRWARPPGGIGEAERGTSSGRRAMALSYSVRQPLAKPQRRGVSVDLVRVHGLHYPSRVRSWVREASPASSAYEPEGASHP